MFTVGDQVTVEIKNTSTVHPMYGNANHTYTGVVLRSENYDAANTFRMSSDHQNVRVRVIPKANVVSINNTPFAFDAQVASVTHTVQGSKGAVYTVTIDAGGHHTCDCSAFKYQPGNCKHIKQFLQ
jgi:hypothetical protein